MGRARTKNERKEQCKNVFIGGPGGRWRPGRRWVEGVAEDMRRLGLRRWRRFALDREVWRDVILKASVLREL